jgi:hypothetical protein
MRRNVLIRKGIFNIVLIMLCAVLTKPITCKPLVVIDSFQTHCREPSNPESVQNVRPPGKNVATAENTAARETKRRISTKATGRANAPTRGVLVEQDGAQQDFALALVIESSVFPFYVGFEQVPQASR